MNFESTLQRDAQGRLFIPPTQRPDGSWRPVKYVKEGYIPQDEQDSYRSKGKIWAEGVKSVGIPGYNGPVKQEEKLTNADLAPKLTKNQKKRQKKRESKKNCEEWGEASDDITTKVSEMSVKDSISSHDNASGNQSNPAAAATGSVDVEKKRKNLTKKLRAIDDLQAKIDTGEVIPDKEQIEKLGRRKEIESQLAAL